ncbi:phage tail length tape measure family protein [Methylorubrum extorquens]|uniref:Prophage tail length tape measure n=1 Tax=Methylorubrum extorquens DSM 13060 TaxID=882800 RepID=H1KGA2_METEX|nr:phage tail length tape measure family protein [Methylorubrum extorquens]EHP93443.1 Prophage tail length tape measure [Methylorubrum extorquens DSM 13060]
MSEVDPLILRIGTDLSELSAGVAKGKSDVLAAANSMVSDLTKVETKATSTAKAVDGLAAATGREAAAEDRASQSRERATAAAARREAAAQREAKALAEGARLQREVSAAQAFFGTASDRATAAAERAAAAHTKGATAARGAAAANDNLGKSSQVATHHLVNLGHQISDIGVSLAGGQNPFLVMIQQGAQIAPILGETGVSGAVRGIGSAVARFVTPAVATMGLLTGAVVLGYGAWARYDEETRNTRMTLEGLGRGLGLTVAQFEDLATSAAKAGNLTARQAADIGRALAATGRIGPENIGRLIEISKDFAATFGLQLDEVKEKLTASFSSVDGITRLNRELNFLDAKTASYVESLFRQGRAEEAIRIAVERLPAALARQEDAQGAVARAWKAIKDAVSEADLATGKFLDRLLKGPAPEDRLKQLQERVTQARDALRNAEADAAASTFSQRNSQALDAIKRPGLGSLPGSTSAQDFRFPDDVGSKQKTRDLQEAEKALAEYMQTQAKAKQAEEETARSKALEESLNRKSNELRGVVKEVANGSDEWLRYRDLQQAVDGALKSGDSALMARVDNVRDLSEAGDVLRHVTESMTNAEGKRMTAAERAAEQRRNQIAGVRAETMEQKAQVAQMDAVARQRGQLITSQQALADAEHAAQMVREQEAAQLRGMLKDRQAEGAEIREQIRLVGADAETRAVAIARRRAEQEIVRGGMSLHSEAAQAVVREAEANARLGVTLDKTVEAQRRMHDAQRQLGDEFARFFDSIIVGGVKAGDAIKGFAQSIASSGLRGLLTGEGPLAGVLGTVGERGQLGGLLGGNFDLSKVFNTSAIEKAVGAGSETGILSGLRPLLEPSKNAEGQSLGVLSSPLGRGLASAGIGASVGYSSGSPMMGVLSGGLAGLMTGNPIMGLVGAGAGLLGGSMGHDQSRKKDRDHERREHLREFAACGDADGFEPVPA